MRRRLFVITLAIQFLAALVSNAGAVTTTGAVLLDFPLNARVRAMGDNGAADNTEPGNIYFNPANVVGLVSRVYAQGTRWSLETGIADDIWLGGLSAGYCHRKESGLALGADVSYGRLDYGESIASSSDGTVLQKFNPADQSVTLTLGAGIPFGTGNELRIGAAGKRWWASYPSAQVSAGELTTIDMNALAFDFGATAVFNRDWSGWHLAPALGAALVNAGSDIEVPIDGATNDPLPTRVHFGGSLHASSPAIAVLGAQVPLISVVANVDGVDRLHDQPFTWGMGSEIAVAEILFLRNGFMNDPGKESTSLESSAWGVGLGIPAERLRLRFDYTHSSKYYEPDIYGIALSWDL